MTYKELMIKSLTDLLEDGETLMHPIYGILNQGNIQNYGYFGFTKTHLLIALISGKQVTYTTRIPLDIKSVRIKQSLIFKQYEIDIGFHYGTPCKIMASPKVMMIDSQVENMPLFLQFLQSKVTEKQAAEFEEVSGEKIRWQYFNTFIYAMLALFPMPLIIIANVGLKDNSFDFSGFIESIPAALPVWIVLLAPFICLSLLNRFFFGKIVCVVNEKGLFVENGLIRWNDIQRITYHPEISGRYKLSYTYATVFVKPSGKAEYALEVMHFPLYGLRKIKKYNPDVKIQLGKNGLFTILFVALTPTLIALILPWLR